MKILITGASGFVGKNLTEALKNIRDGKDRFHPEIVVDELYLYDIDTPEDVLIDACRNADFVFNLAGVNRPQNPEEFMQGNFGFASKLLDTLKQFGVPYELHIYSAHRTPVEAKEFSENARANGFGVIIAAAGMAAHLAGAIAANTTLPVIGIPVKSSTLDGLDALLSTVQMPSGMPVATVAIDGSANAALLAIQIIAVSEPALAEKLDDARKANTAKILAKDAEISAQYNK